jgi:deazaflavin-dependent oxidoreductase (nitroreductase family)
MPESAAHYKKETRIERILNRAFGFAVRLGIGPSYNYLLEVRGRKSGRVYATPVNLIEVGGRRYLVASRGETAWARNARAAGAVTLRKGSKADLHSVRELPATERPPVLKAFVDRYAAQVQRFHSVPKGSPVEAFVATASLHPVFELLK